LPRCVFTSLSTTRVQGPSASLYSLRISLTVPSTTAAVWAMALCRSTTATGLRCAAAGAATWACAAMQADAAMARASSRAARGDGRVARVLCVFMS